MRKNIYNDKILMMEISEINGLSSCIGRKLCDKEVISVLREYLSIDGMKKFKDAEAYDKEIGLLLDEEITLKIKESYEKYRENFLVSLESINNAFIWAITTNTDSEICNTLRFMIINRELFTIKELRETYGDDVLEYILLYGNYNIKSGLNPVFESDKKIQLITNGELKEVVVVCSINQEYLSTNSYRGLRKYLNDKIGDNLMFEQCQEKQEVIEIGKYHRTPSDINGISFCCKLRKDNSLKIEVSSYLKDGISVNEKLEVLRIFYEILSKRYGEPSSYYVQRDDIKEALDIVWDFTKKVHIDEINSDIFFSDNDLKIVYNYIIGSGEGSFRYIVDRQLQENLDTPLYDNDMGLEKKPIQP